MTEQSGLYKKIYIVEVKEVVRGFKEFVLEPVESFALKSGQYLTFVSQLQREEVRRSYSITSSPELHEPLSIGVKRIDNGYFSRLLVDHAKPGDELVTSGGGGLFILPADTSAIKQLFFFAAGSGITPIYSLLKTALHFHPHLSIVLVYSNRSPESTIFLPELKQLQQKFSRQLKIVWLFSNAADLTRARLYRALLKDEVKGSSIARFDQTLYYVCGPLAYMRMCVYALQEMHVPASQIRKEDFFIQKVKPPQLLPPDANAHEVKISFGKNEYSLLVQYPDSILQSAKKEGIALPYSCEAGRCGNCVARCIKGKVWLSYNEVLTEADLAKGLTLTCVGHPMGGDVELAIEQG